MSKAQIKLFEDSFEDFAQRTDLPNFDFICLHGIWNWVSDKARASILKLISKKLNPGGILYCSYNVSPGFLPMQPVRHMMKKYHETTAVTNPLQETGECFNFLDKVFAANPRYAALYPAVKQSYENLKSKDAHYLAHEYLNSHWDLFYFDEISAQFEDNAKCQFAASADATGGIDGINLTEAQRAVLGSISSPGFRQTMHDILTNNQFRRDYYIKGARTLNPREKHEQLREERLVLTGEPKNFDYKYQALLGNADLKKEVYSAVLDLMADHQLHTVGELEDKLKDKVDFDNLITVVLILMAKGMAAPGHEMNETSKAQCLALNQELLRLAEHGYPINFLASPVTGGGVAFSSLDLLFIKELFAKPEITAEEMSGKVANLLASLNATISIKDKGKDKSVCPASKEGLKEMTKSAANVLHQRETFKALGILV